MNNQKIWIAIWSDNTKSRWQDQPQEFLGEVSWSEAVKYAKSQKGATRLSTSAGFDNQGHYFQSEQI